MSNLSLARIIHFSSILLLLVLQDSSVKAEIDIDPTKIIQQSPTLQHWQQGIPDILWEIDHDRAFYTHIRLGYLQSPSENNTSGIEIGIDDIFIGTTGLTLSADYQISFSKSINSTAVDLQYYILPLGYVVNIAPLLGYRSLNLENYNTSGLNLGAKLKLNLSRDDAADITLSQSFLNIGSSDQVGLTRIAAGYALSNSLRIAAEIQEQNSRVSKQSQVGIFLEWIIR